MYILANKGFQYWVVAQIAKGKQIHVIIILYFFHHTVFKITLMKMATTTILLIWTGVFASMPGAYFIRQTLS